METNPQIATKIEEETKKLSLSDFQIGQANKEHYRFSKIICATIEQSAKERGTGIAKRSKEYVESKIAEGKAIIAFKKSDQSFAGFCYIETWGHGRFAANSGLIVSPNYRGIGLAHAIKKEAFLLSRRKYPEAKLFGLTTSLPVMKINSDLGYKPVTFSELTDDEAFWKGCRSCVNYDILTRTERKHCLCTGMLYQPEEKDDAKKKAGKNSWFSKLIDRLKKG